MSLTSRIRGLVLSSRGQSGGIVTRAATGMSPASLGLETLGSESRGRPRRYGTREALEAYDTSPWVHAIVDRISDSVANLTWEVYRAKKSATRRALSARLAHRKRLELKAAMVKEGDLEPVEAHPVVDLLDAGNWFQSGFEVQKLWQLYVDLAGEGFGVIEMDGSGKPSEIWPVPPHWMRERPGPGSRYDSFRLRPEGLGGDQENPIPPEHVLWFRQPSPLKPYANVTGKAIVLGDEIDTDEAAAKLLKQTFANGARPDILITTDHDMAPEEAKGFLERWNAKLQGWWNVRKVHLLTGKVTVHDLASSFVDLGVKDLRHWERDMLIHYFGMPAEIMGITESSNRATASVADYIYQSKVVVPRADRRRIVYQSTLMPLYGDEQLVLDYVSPVEEDADFTQKSMSLHPYAFRVDEIRALAGHPELPDGMGQVFVGPIGVIASETPAGADFGGAVAPDEDEEDDDTTNALALPRATRKDLTVDQIEAILAELTDKDMREAIEPVLRQVIEQFGSAQLAELGVETAFNMQSVAVQEFLSRSAGAHVRGIGKTTRGKLRRVLTQASADGLGTNDIARKLRAQFRSFKGRRSLLIAQQETARASTFAVNESMKQGGVEEKEWLSTRDDRVRESHQALDGQRVPVDDNFTSPVTGNSGPHPTELGDPQDDLACRCVALAVVQGETGVGANEAKRTAAWLKRDRSRLPWQRRLVRGVRGAFDAQERQVLDALERVGG